MEEVTCLRQMYEAMFLNSQSKIVHISSLCHQFSRVKLANMLISSKLAKSDRSSYIYAKWFNNLTETPPQDLSRPGYIHFFLKHTIKLENQGSISSFEIFLASVSWYKNHPEKIIFIHLQYGLQITSHLI